MSVALPKNDAPHESRLPALRARMRELGSVLVCFSGGIDSALVLAVAHEQLGPGAVAMTAVGPALPQRERDEAARIAAEIGARHHFVDSREIERPGYVANGPDRCFHCKTELYELAAQKRDEWGLATLANGTNADDLGDYRPGLDAAREAQVVSPLLDAGLDKEAVRRAAAELGLRVWNKPASACLSSRIPYGSSVTRERLAQIEGFENALKDLGFQQLRVRWHDTIARVEVDLTELPRLLEVGVREAVVAAGKAQGFRYVALDLAGYRQGSQNEVLAGRSLRVL